MLSTQYEVVACWSQRDGHATSHENKREDIAVLCARVVSRRMTTLELPLTFSLQSKKNFIGFSPYAAAEPNHGIQCQTTGGNDRSLGNCRRVRHVVVTP